jgi:SAM-dependent methyltransferase
MLKRGIRKKFGNDYTADKKTFMMGIDQRFTAHMAERFRERNVLETCTGAGFTTIAVAREAAHVTTVEIEASHLAQARNNVAQAGLLSKVTFISGNILDEGVLNTLPPINAAFLDPDWAVSGPNHVFRFLNSNTRPPADQLLERILRITEDIALVLPPRVNTEELHGLAAHERESLYMEGKHELYCLYFGGLARSPGETSFYV